LQEYNKRPRANDSAAARKYHTHHVVSPCTLSLQEVLGLSDVVISAVPNAEYKIKTEWLKDGCLCLNVAADKNFEKDVRDKVGLAMYDGQADELTSKQASMYLPSVGKVTIMMLLRNL
jgi:methylenetetrahydrofolate dehydrogenase (NAD+)